MKSCTRMLVGGGVLVLFLAPAFLTPVWTQQNQGVPLRIAVVNIREVFSQYKVAIEFENSLEDEKSKMQAEIDRIESEMKKIMAEVEQLDRRSPVWKQRSLRLVQLDSERKFLKEEWEATVTRRLNENTAAIYNRIRNEIDAYAAEHGIDLVLKIETKRLELQSAESANARINRRNVLAWKDSLDITNAIIERLNKQ